MIPSGTGTRTQVSCVKGRYANHLHHTGHPVYRYFLDVRTQIFLMYMYFIFCNTITLILSNTTSHTYYSTTIYSTKYTHDQLFLYTHQLTIPPPLPYLQNYYLPCLLFMINQLQSIYHLHYLFYRSTTRLTGSHNAEILPNIPRALEISDLLTLK